MTFFVCVCAKIFLQEVKKKLRINHAALLGASTNLLRQIMRTPASTQNMVVAASCCRDAFLQQEQRSVRVKGKTG